MICYTFKTLQLHREEIKLTLTVPLCFYTHINMCEVKVIMFWFFFFIPGVLRPSLVDTGRCT